MARRFHSPYQSEPVSAFATWARALALFSLVATIGSVVIIRFGFLEIRPALATFLGALALAAFSILAALAGFAAIWHYGTRGTARILLALLVDAAILAYPGYLAWQYRRLPAIHDITTDPIDPPRFEQLAKLRTGDGANPATYAGLYSAELQQSAYPDIEPVSMDVPPAKAFDEVLKLVQRRKWTLIDQRPPQPPRNIGRIEAVARTLIMGFREDVVIRVVPDAEGARVDIRSASRFFEHDLGTNAARVAKLIDDLNDMADAAAKPSRKPATPAKIQTSKGPAKR